MNPIRSLLAAGFLLALTPAGAAAPPKPDQAAVNGALARATAYLRATSPAATHGTAIPSLVGLALLEAKVKPDDPAVRAITSAVRAGAAAETETYRVSLAILYLDLLGDTRDLALIQLLGTRLYAGMLPDGGYSYQCPDLQGLPAGALAGTVPVQPKEEKEKPKARPEKDGFLPVPGRKADPKDPGAAANAGRLHPSVAPVNAAVRRLVAANGRAAGSRDNSNTQFGLIGLWVAARHGVPADDAFALLEAGFLTSQSRADGGWGYNLGGNSTAAMTCAGLLGLAVGGSRKPEAKAPDPKKPAGGDDPFDAPPERKGGAKPGARLGPAVAAGLNFVGRVIRVAAPPDGLGAFVGAGDVYYTLWSVERVGMAFGLDTIGDVNWYDWGCGFLLPRQQASGAWSAGGGTGDDVSTSFAVLFLLRANFVADITGKVKGKVKDPGRAALVGGTGFQRPPGAPADDPPAPADPAATRADPDQLAADLVATPNFLPVLRAYRDTKGTEYTQAILKAVPKLPAEKQEQARDALADRLTRMTAKTLKAQLADPDAELRRAAARACGPKADKEMVSPLIGRIGDPSEPVSQAARGSLKTLTGQDHGPEAGATVAAVAAAKAAWNRWFLGQK